MKKFVCLLTMMAMFPAVPALAAPADSYSAILANWQQHLCGDSANASKDVLAAYLKTTASNAAGQQKSMNKTNLDAGYLWPGKPIAPGGSSPNIGSAFESLRQMAKGYATPGTTTYHNASLLTDIAFGLNFLWQNVYHSGNITMTAYDKDTNPNGWYGNWWDWEIDMPDKLTDIMVMVGDELDSTTRSNALWMIDVFCQRPETGTLQPIQRYKYEGANRAWRVKCVILSSAMQQDAARLQNAVAQFRPLYQYVDEGEGFYRDGTFIAHTAFSYTGGYGITQIQYWSYIFQMIAGTQFDIGADEKLMLYDILENAFVPGLVNGAFMDMFRGREISRYNTTDYDAGHKALRAMLMLADDAPEPQRSRILGVVKEQERLSRGQRDIYSGAAIDEMIALDRILNDTSIANVPQTPFHKNYPYSDRTVHRGDGYTFGIAMFSERIHNFEGKERDENREGWYTGAGATYLYLDNDLAQYTDYYPTIDPTRLPGITASTRYPQPVIMRGDTEIPNRPYENSSVWNRQSWVGGVESGLYGVTGMQFEDIETPTFNKDWSLMAKKSWFMFDDEIVCIGSDIHSSDPEYAVQTIAENRKIDASQTLTVDGAVKNNTAAETVAGARYAAISGVGGYYFPGGASVGVQKKEQQGTWREVNQQYPNDSVKKATYATLWFDHGVSPENGSYQYVILPGMTEQQTREYANNPDIAVLQNDDAVHAVKQMTDNVLGANFWKETGGSVDGLTVDGPCSVMVTETEGEIVVALSDPNHAESGTAVHVTLERPGTELISADTGVTVSGFGENLLRFTFQVGGTDGKTLTARIKRGNLELDTADVTVDYPEYLLTGTARYPTDVTISLNGQFVHTISNVSSGFEWPVVLDVGENVIKVTDSDGVVLTKRATYQPVPPSNEIPDPSFEISGNIGEHWTGLNNAYTKFSDNAPHTGKRCLYGDTITNGSQSSAGLNTDIPVPANTELTLTWWARFEGEGANGYSYMGIYPAGTTNFAPEVRIAERSICDTGAGNDWRQYSLTFHTGDCTAVRVGFTSKNMRFFIDDLKLPTGVIDQPVISATRCFYEGMNQAVDTIPQSGDIVCRTYVHNNSAVSCAPAYTAALYNGDALVSVIQTGQQEIAAGRWIKYEFRVPKKPSADRTYTLKILTWENMKSVKPYQAGKEIKYQ